MLINYNIKTICQLDNPVISDDNLPLGISAPCMFMYEYDSFL